MKLAVAVIAALLAPGCENVFPLELEDRFVHVPREAERIGELDVIVPKGETYSVDTGNDAGGDIVPTGANFVNAEFDVVAQEAVGDDLPDLAVMRVHDLTIESDATLRVRGTRPFVVLAKTISIVGSLDGSANGDTPGPNGGRPEAGDRGEGGAGQGGLTRNHAGGGGGGYAVGSGAGGTVTCADDALILMGGASIDGASAGADHGDDDLTVLRGGGAGGRGGFACAPPTPPGAGGGAIQLSAGTITIDGTGKVLAGGGGGAGGRGNGTCSSTDGAGSGGGAGGAIYLDADVIDSKGLVAANGGGGGGGGGDGNDGTGSGDDGKRGKDATDLGDPTQVPPIPAMPSAGGAGIAKKGTFGGNGASDQGSAGPGTTGACTATQVTVNAGGGGGAFGRIVFHGTIRAKGVTSPPLPE